MGWSATQNTVLPLFESWFLQTNLYQGKTKDQMDLMDPYGCYKKFIASGGSLSHGLWWNVSWEDARSQSYSGTGEPIPFLQGHEFPAEVTLSFTLAYGVLWFTSTDPPCNLFFLAGFSVWLSTPHRVRHSDDLKKSAENLALSITRSTDRWWTSESWIQLWELELSTVSVCQGPEEATQHKMEAQCVQSMIKTCQYLSTCPTCLGFLHALPLAFLAYYWYSLFYYYLLHQHSILPQSIGQFVLWGSFLMHAVHEKSWTQARNLQPQEEGRTL